MIRIEELECVGCGLCARVCPSGAITINSGKAQINHSLCTNCLLCTSICPQQAITQVADKFAEIRFRLSRLNGAISALNYHLERLNRKF